MVLDVLDPRLLGVEHLDGLIRDVAGGEVDSHVLHGLRIHIGHLGGGPQWHHVVDADIVLAPLHGQGLGDAVDIELRGRVSGNFRLAKDGRRRGHGDQHRALRRLQIGVCCLCAEGDAKAVNVQDLTDLVLWLINQQAIDDDAGVVEQEVQAATGLCGEFCQCLIPVSAVRYIEVAGDELAFRNIIRAPRGVLHVVGANGPPKVEQALRRCLTNAGGATGDECSWALLRIRHKVSGLDIRDLTEVFMKGLCKWVPHAFNPKTKKRAVWAESQNNCDCPSGCSARAARWRGVSPGTPCPTALRP